MPRPITRRSLLGLLFGLPVASPWPVGGQERRTELLMFEEPGCPWCRRWRAEVGPGYASSAEGRRAPLRVVAMHAPLPAGIALASRVTASPTFVLIDNGREIGRIVGYPGEDFFWGMLEGLLKKLAP